VRAFAAREKDGAREKENTSNATRSYTGHEKLELELTQTHMAQRAHYSQSYTYT